MENKNGVTIHSHERLDELHRNGYRIIQDPGRFCFGMDAVLLSGFAKVKPGERALDLGTGTGIIPILLEAKTKGEHFTGLEIQPESADMAARSVAYNHLEEKITIVTGDIKEASARFGAGSFEVITTNPPYMIGQHGIQNDANAKTIARHEVLCDLDDILRESAKMLKQGGRFYMVHRPFRALQLHDGRDGGILHDPENSVDGRFDLIHPVGGPELGLDGPAVAVADILSDQHHLAVLVQRGGAVLRRQQVLVVRGIHRIVGGLVEIGRLQSNGGAGIGVDDEGVIVEHLDGGILAAVLGVGQGGLAGAGQTEHGRDELVAVRQRVFLLTAVAAGVAIAVGDGPGQGQGALLVLAEVAHTQDGGAVGLRVEVAQALGVADLFLTGCAGPLGIGEDVDVRLLAVAYGLGVLVHLHIFRGHILEVQHPVVEEVFLTLRDQQMGLHHELGVQTDEHLGVIHGLPAGVVHGVHDDLIQGGGVHAGLAGDAAGGGVAAGDARDCSCRDHGRYTS